MLKTLIKTSLGCLGLVVWLIILAFALTRWPRLEHSTLAFLALALPLYLGGIVLFWYVRRRAECLLFLRRRHGQVILVATSRKGWFPLFQAANPHLHGVLLWWWRDLHQTHPLFQAARRYPPVALPFLARVQRSGITFEPVGDRLRAPGRRALRDRLAILEELTTGESTKAA